MPANGVQRRYNRVPVVTPGYPLPTMNLPVTCAFCDARLFGPRTVPPRLYCSATCRSHSWRRAQEQSLVGAVHNKRIAEMRVTALEWMLQDARDDLDAARVRLMWSTKEKAPEGA